MKENFTPLRVPKRFGLKQLVVMIHAALLATAVGAFEIETADPDWQLRFDNTLKFSASARTESANPALKDSFRLLVPGVPQSAFPQALNFNAGDQNFQKTGFFSERFDLLSEFDVVWRKDFGARLSAAGWYDAALFRSTDADPDPFIGQTPYNQFPSNTKVIAGRDIELLDAFAFGGWRFDDGMKLTARAGQFAQLWGESLFFGDNGVARAQGPVYIDKLLASPNAQFKEIIRPVPQLSGQLQITPDVSVAAYYQFQWKSDRLPPSGSYFSVANIPWGSAQPEFVSIPNVGNFVLNSASDQNPKNSGQYGAQLKWRVDENDLGFYFANFHDKDGQLYGNINPAAPPSPFGTLPGQWFYSFPSNVKVYGASWSRTVGDFNLALEGSVRDNMPLRSGNMIYAGGVGQPQPQPAKGTTAHLNFSWLATLGPSFISKEANFLGEIAWNRVLSYHDPDNELDQGRTRNASIIQAIYAPVYRQALPGLDLSVPIGIRYSMSGSSSVTAWDSSGNGSFNVGLEGNYLSVWQLALTYTHYFGSAVPFIDYSPLLTGGVPIYGHGNPLADRSYVAFTIRRTF